MRLRFLLGLFLTIPLVAMANRTLAESSADSKPVDVTVTLSEYKFQSSLTTFSQGVPYRFIVMNAGRKEHEFAIMPKGVSDTSKALVEVDEDDLPPNTTVTRTFTFNQTGDFEFACHVGHHYEKGMVLPIVVQ